MAISYLSPNVNVRDLSGIVPVVSTTEGGMTGQFRWGPINYLTLVDSEITLSEIFFTPNNTNASDWFTASNFLAYGNALWIARVVNETHSNTALRARNATAANSSGFLVRNDDEYRNQYYGGELDTQYGTGPWIARYAGELGNSLKISVCPSSSAYESTLTGTVTISANSATVTGSSTNFANTVTVGDLFVVNSETHKVSAIANNTSLTLSTRHISGCSANTAVRRWEYYAEVDLAPTTSNYAASVGGSNDELHIVIVDEDGAWTNEKNTVLETYQYLSKASDARVDNGSTNYYKEVINQKSKYVHWAAHSNKITNAGQTAPNRAFGAWTKPLNNSFVGGNDGTVISNKEKLRGFDLFKSPEDVDVSILLGSEANQTVAVHVINNIVEDRKDCVAFFSVPKNTVVNNANDESNDIVTFRNTLPSTSYAALDGNWKYQYDKYNDVYRYVPMNGDVGGLHVQTDNNRDPWWAAAGLNRGLIKNTINLAWNPRLAYRDQLYKNNVNPIFISKGDGPVLWGQKTLLTKPSAFDRINVRRLFITIEKAISKAAKYFLFEFNDEITRAQFRNMVEPYLRDVKGRRGIYDFRVICDSTNNTPEVIDRNQFVATILVKPARVAEWITLNFVAVRTGVAFEEIAGQQF